MSTRTHSALVAVLAVAFFAPSPAAAQTSKSSAAVKMLTQALDAAKLDSIAAPDPSDPASYAAALYISGSQLLVVSAKYAAPPLLAAKMKSKDYRDIYIDLSAASMPGTKVFIIDQNCDGLMARPGDNGADSWEAGKSQVTFDGEWRKAKLSEDEYMKAFSAADEHYARILALLAAQAKQ
jgi:type II secretory pathway pseudopilin PulG